MFPELEKTIADFYSSTWAQFSPHGVGEFDINNDFEDIKKYPANSVITEDIRIDVATQDGDLTATVSIAIYTAFKNVNNATDRRRGALEIVELLMRLINGKEFENEGLEIDPIRPVGAKEIYHAKLKEVGGVCYRTVLTTSMTITSIDDQEIIRLLSERVSYLLDPESETAAATDLMEFPEE